MKHIVHILWTTNYTSKLFFPTDGQKQSVQVVQSAMVPNPIYEGPMYETIVRQNFDSLAANAESESDRISELRYLENPIFPARIGGEADTRIIPVTDYASLTPADDNYTVMSPIESHSMSNLMNKPDDAENQ